MGLNKTARNNLEDHRSSIFSNKPEIFPIITILLYKIIVALFLAIKW